MTLYHKHFSHIYAEYEALNYRFSKKIISKLPASRVIKVNNYKDVFFRKTQSFHLQKKSKNIILAVKKSDFLYKGSDFAQSAGNQNFYYNALSLNCLYDCSYCYLQGMYPSANIVFFVNLDDYFTTTEKAVANRMFTDQPLFLSLSYDTDLLATEQIAPYCRHWIEFASSNPHLLCEIRTKCSNFKPLLDLEPNHNILFSWTISPEDVAKQHENNAPPTKQRIAAAKMAAERGWSIRLCFDPIIPLKNWRLLYDQCIDDAFDAIPLKQIHDCTIGTFRMSATHLKLARQRRPNSQLLQRNWETINGTSQPPPSERHALTSYVIKRITKWLPEKNIHLWL